MTESDRIERAAKRINVPLSAPLVAELEAARRDLEQRAGVRLSLAQAAQSLIRRGIEHHKAA